MTLGSWFWAHAGLGRGSCSPERDPEWADWGLATGSPRAPGWSLGGSAWGTGDFLCTPTPTSQLLREHSRKHQCMGCLNISTPSCTQRTPRCMHEVLSAPPSCSWPRAQTEQTGRKLVFGAERASPQRVSCSHSTCTNRKGRRKGPFQQHRNCSVGLARRIRPEKALTRCR